MDQKNLRSLLEQLHNELTTNSLVDGRSQHLLQELQQDIEQSIALDGQPTDTTTPHSDSHNLRERMQKTMASFEGSHPQYAGAFERIMTLLSNFGL